ncbi:hypothetical protein Tco_0865083 [Tanacetum coccineum]
MFPRRLEANQEKNRIRKNMNTYRITTKALEHGILLNMGGGKLIFIGFRVTFIFFQKKLWVFGRDDKVLDIEKSPLPTLDTGDEFGKQMRNVFLRPLGEGQPFTTSTQIKEPPEELDGGLVTISFAHNNKGSQFGTTKRVKPRYINLKILKNFTKKLCERQPEICERKQMSVQSDISRRSIKNSLVGFRKNNMVCRRNRIECEKVIELFLKNLTSLNSCGIFGTHAE